MQSKSILKLVCLFVVVCVCLTGLNFITAPIIEKNAASGAFEPLFKVMPEAQGFEEVLDLADVDEKVVGVYRETSGLGYAVSVSTSEGYTHEPIEFTLAFDGEGKISNIDIINNPETKDWGADYPTSFIGQDSTLADVQLVAGVTFASKALKEATTCAFDALINNDLLSAGKMGPEQILSLLMLEKFPAMKSASGANQYDEVTVDGYAKGFKAKNGAGYGFIKVDGEDGNLVVVNTRGDFAVYDLEGNDVTESKADVAAAAVSFAGVTSNEKDAKRLVSFAGVDVSDLKPVSMEGVFNTVIDAYKIGNNYGFVCKSYGFAHDMTELFILDQNGSIVKMTVDEILQEAEYFSVKVDDDAYKAGFVGVNVESFDGSQALIAGATISTGAITTAAEDVFNAYQTIVGGNN